MPDWSQYGDPSNITLTDDSVPDAFKICVIQGVADAEASFSGGVGTRIGSVFVIFFVSTFVTMFPLLAQKFKWRLSIWFYLFAKFFGAGVIIATAFVHLMDPSYGSIGGDSCVGMWGNWAIYSWVPALMLASIFGVFLTELFSEVYVERKYGYSAEDIDVQKMLTQKPEEQTVVPDEACYLGEDCAVCDETQSKKDSVAVEERSITSSNTYEFKTQFAAFLILEFGVIFHSVIIGLNLGSTDYDEFKTLYIVLVFHQSFEGLGIGARLSAIPWPKSKPEIYKYLLCLAYGLVTPISVAIGIGVRTTYSGSTYTANVVSGTLDALSAGILVYTGMVEFLARDFIFNRQIKKKTTELMYSLFCLCLGTGIMALIGKWA
jgi:zinc transporter 1/2/3